VTHGTDEGLRIEAANYILPFKHAKRAPVPAPRFIEEPTTVPEFHSIQQAEDYLASIPVMLGRGELDSPTALELSQLTKNWLDAIYAHQEYDLKLEAQGEGAEQTIRIVGGLEPLPGTNIIGMGGEPAHVNGHNGHCPTIDGDAQLTIKSIPELKDVT
jgi:hypothetical protein